MSISHINNQMAFNDEASNITANVISNGKKYVFSNKLDHCVNKMHDSDDIVTIVYSGLCKTKANIKYILDNGIDHVLVYNKRELTMLDQMNVKYLLKLKLDFYDIGIHFSQFDSIICDVHENLIGLYISFTKASIRDHLFQTSNAIVSEFDPLIFEQMRHILSTILQKARDSNINLKVVVLDIYGYDNQLDNNQNSHVMFKLSMYNYIRDVLGYQNCSVI